jgi:KUP system potassium uptake protein
MPSSNSENDSPDEPKGEFFSPRINKKIILLAIASIGVVFGDIGTSPLYAIKACFHGKHAIDPSMMNILGVLSLIFWSITVVVSIKYLTFILRADNRGEGGIFALVSLLNTSDKKLSRFIQAVLLLAGILGAGLLYGDGVITPAISVLSAIEGLEVATKAATPFIVPLTCIVLVLLFSLQQKGTANIGKLFAPIMVLWFVAIGFFGLVQITREPTVLLALNPVYALEFFMNNGIHGIVVL